VPYLCKSNNNTLQCGFITKGLIIKICIFCFILLNTAYCLIKYFHLNISRVKSDVDSFCAVFEDRVSGGDLNSDDVVLSEEGKGEPGPRPLTVTSPLVS
jgi:hypothetical protein